MFAPSLPYFVIVAFWLVGAVLTGFIHADAAGAREGGCDAQTTYLPASASSATIRRSSAPSRSICSRCCSAASTALLPIYARDILQTGPLGLGILRAAPAVGALLMTIVLARHSINRHVGLRMFQAVIVFGVATVVFALSQWMWLSVLALAVLGAADTISVVIRFSLVQLATPDEMRGRVGAVNFLFINASQPARPVRERRHRGAVRHRAGRRARRRRHHRDRAVVDEAVSVAAEGGAAGVGGAASSRDAGQRRTAELAQAGLRCRYS